MLDGDVFDKLHAMKYRSRGETFRDRMNGAAAAVKDGDKHFRAIREIFIEQRFLPAGGIQAAMGSGRGVTASNCFVSGTIRDSFVDGDGNIMQRAAEAAATMRKRGGIGFDFSTLRPRGAKINGIHGESSGPVAFMDIFDAVCGCTSSAGMRRGAQMGVLRVDHPDILEFVRAKHNNNKLTGFNVSVGMTDAFMEAVLLDKPFDLKFNGLVYQTVQAAELFDIIMRSTWDWAEPGVLFLDTINRWNNLWYCETIAATNPCGEQPLPPYGACLLGSFNLPAYVHRGAAGGVGEWLPSFDWVQYLEDIPHVVRAMDNVIDRSTYPLDQQRYEQIAKRRMGLGITGLANAAEALGYPYGSEGFLSFERTALELLRDHSYRASMKLAREKGAFPKFDAANYLSGKFIATLPHDIRSEIHTHGTRNSHLTSIAPTGTISMCAGNVSSGIEPVFSYSEERKINTFDGPEFLEVSDYGYREFDVKGKLSRNVTLQEHIDVLATAAVRVDSAVSKTINYLQKNVEWEEFKRIYVQAWQAGAKGCTTFAADGKRFALRVEVPEGEGSCTIDAETGQKDCG